MKALIVYATRYGTTARCARLLAERLSGSVDLFELGRRGSAKGDGTTASEPLLDEYDTVVIGGPIYGGRILRAVSRFCDANRELLEERKVGLFLCCLYSGEAAAAELAGAFPPWLQAHAAAKAVLGGAVTLARLSAVDRYLVRRVAQVDEDLSTVEESAIERLADELNRAQ